MDPACPYTMYDQLRREAPVFRNPETGVWMVTRAADVLAMVKDPGTFSSRWMSRMGGPGFSMNPPRDAVCAVFDDGGYPLPEILSFADPPEQTQHRALVTSAFSQRRVTQLEPAIRGFARDLVQDWPDGEELDFVARFAIPLPISVVATAMGVPPVDHVRFRRWSDAVLERAGYVLTEEQDVADARLVVELQRYIADLIDERVAAPTDDMLSDLIHAEVDGARLSVPEVIGIATLILVAGNDTTRSLLSSTMLTLTEHPEVMDLVRHDRSLLPAVIEEVVRLHSPVVGTPRLTTADVELGGVTIPAGELVMAMWGAGNRDPEQFPEPAEFRLHRDNIKSHLAFGWGNHFCIGSKLARAEVLMAFDVLFDEFSSLELAPGATPRFGNSLLAQSYESLPILVKRSTEGGGYR